MTNRTDFPGTENRSYFLQLPEAALKRPKQADDETPSSETWAD